MFYLENLSKAPVWDSQREHIGHIQDLGFTFGASFPVISIVGLHIFETDYIGKIPLLRTVEDIVLTLPHDCVSRLDGEGFHLKGKLSDFSVAQLEDEIFLRRDLLNAQVLDSEEHRIQRVDDLFLESKNDQLFLTGILAGFGGMLNRLDLSGAAKELREKMGVELQPEMVPWNLVESCGKLRSPIKLKIAFKE